MPLFVPGIPRLATLNSSGVKTATLHLPMPDKASPGLEWIEKGFITDLKNGNESNRRLGFIPQLTFRWAIYVDQIQASFTEGVTPGAWNYVIGPGDGQMPSISDLMAMLGSKPGTLEVSPGPSAGGFIAESWKIKPMGVNDLGLAQGVEITFRGGTAQSAPVLGTF